MMVKPVALQAVRVVAVLCILVTAGCLSVDAPPPPPLVQLPTTAKLGTFKDVHLRHLIIDPTFETHEVKANQRARWKIDEYLFNYMRYVFADLQEVDMDFDRSKTTGLLIEPVVDEITFIGGPQRFWAGAMAGSSFVKLTVTFTDLRTGEVLAATEFYRSVNPFAGSYSIGATDNEMLRDIAHDVCDYARLNF